nr:hypothetical protein CFP56_57010 [Quercus suber]
MPAYPREFCTCASLHWPCLRLQQRASSIMPSLYAGKAGKASNAGCASQCACQRASCRDIKMLVSVRHGDGWTDHQQFSFSLDQTISSLFSSPCFGGASGVNF